VRVEMPVGGPYNNIETERHCNYRTSTGSWKRANYAGCKEVGLGQKMMPGSVVLLNMLTPDIDVFFRF